MTTATQDTVKPDTFEWQGETKAIPPVRGYDLLARYREAAAALHAAKERAKQIEQEIMRELGGFEHGSIDGQQVFHWPFVDSTNFKVKEFKDAGYRDLYAQFCGTKTTRRFKVDGTVGVD